jgi:hypothetical protein
MLYVKFKKSSFLVSNKYLQIVYIGTSNSRDVILREEFFFEDKQGRKSTKFNTLITTYEIILKDSKSIHYSTNRSLIIICRGYLEEHQVELFGCR